MYYACVGVCIAFVTVSEFTIKLSKLAFVDPYMILESTLLPELFGAVGTVVWFLSGMDLHVIVERGHLPETCITDLAFVWFLARVCLNVVNQGTLLGEEAPADATTKWAIGIVAS